MQIPLLAGPTTATFPAECSRVNSLKELHMELNSHGEGITFAEGSKEKVLTETLAASSERAGARAAWEATLREAERLTCMVRRDVWSAFQFSGTGRPQASSYLSMHIKYFRVIFPRYKYDHYTSYHSPTPSHTIKKLKVCKPRPRPCIASPKSLPVTRSPSLPWDPLYSLCSAHHYTACTNTKPVHSL